MDEQQARSILAEVEKAGESLNVLTEISMQLPEPEGMELRRHLADGMIALSYDVVAFVVRRFPHLDPDLKA